MVGWLVGWLVGLSRFYMDLVRAVTLSFNGGFSNNLAQMFTMMRRRVACKTHVLSSKVKVTLRGQRSNMGIMRLVRDRSCSFMVGFSNNLAQIRGVIDRKKCIDISKD